MAKKGFLNCLEKRELLNQPAVSVDTLLSWGRSFEEADSLYDAVDFYHKANAADALARILERAKEEGNVFLSLRICRLLRLELPSDEWRRIAERAEELGKNSSARQAYRLAGVVEDPATP